jgi:endonuclease III related protein
VQGHVLWAPALEFAYTEPMHPATAEHHVLAMYSMLTRVWGPQHWWPARTPFEVVVGAYLTQNTNWANVETALAQLRSAGVLSLTGIRKTSKRKLERLLRSSGYYRQKARRLKIFVTFLDHNYDGSLKKMFAQPTAILREELLALEGVGPETADSILLYAAQHPIFVVDAYTRRISERHGLLSAKAPYEEFRKLFERGLSAGATPVPSVARVSGAASHLPSPMSLAARPPLAQIFNEMHGLIVGVGKKYCLKAEPKCVDCPLKFLLPASRSKGDL